MAEPARALDVRMPVDRAYAATYAPRFMGIDKIAAHTGYSPTMFLQLVAEGRLPRPIQTPGHRRKIWDRIEVEAWIEGWRDQGPEAADEWAEVD